jgi:hypothetical protein
LEVSAGVMSNKIELGICVLKEMGEQETEGREGGDREMEERMR